MLKFLRDKMETARLKARYQRLVQERVLSLIETSGPQAVAEDPGNWTLVGDTKSTPSEIERTDARSKARKLVVDNPHARNILRLLEIYVAGPELKLKHVPVRRESQLGETLLHADHLWKTFVEENRPHFSYREYARRAWRDGECFLRKFPSPVWPPTARFIDPEAIAATAKHPDSRGILTAGSDVENPVAYLRIDPASGNLLEQIAADDVFHTKLGVDSNQKRGLTIFAPILDVLACFDNWRETELLARKLQASIVLWRKVQGSPSQVSAAADAVQSTSALEPGSSVRKERYRAGTILTTSHGTELQYLQPNTNFGDAVPLGRLLLLSTAAGAGLPEFMLTSDASNANFASTMVAEGPAVKLFQSEQQFFVSEFRRIWKWAMSEAIRLGLLPAEFFEQVNAEWTFPQLVNRDRPRERAADARLVQTKILSRAEVARREGTDPDAMQSEIESEVARLGP